MARELKNANITHISYVDKGANQKRFFFTKSAKKPDFEKQVRLITKADDPKKLVYGVVYEPDVEDTHGDIMTADEIEKAVHGFMSNLAIAKGAVMDTQHDFDPGVGDVVECYVAPVDFEMGEETIKKGSWVLVTKANDDIWNKIQDGEVTGYSMAGTAETIEKQKEPAAKSNDEATGFFNAMKSFFTGEKIAKGAVADSFNRRKKDRQFWAAQDALNSVLFRWDHWGDGMETDPDIIREALQDFVEIAQDVLIQEDIVKAIGNPPEQIAKAGKKISNGNMKHIDDAIAALTELKTKTTPKKDDEGSEEEDDLNAEDIAKAVQAAMEPIAKQVEALNTDIAELKKQEEDGSDIPAGTEPSADSKPDALTDAITKALAPLTDQVQALAADVQIVKNSRGGSAQGGAEDEIQKSAGVSFDGLL